MKFIYVRHGQSEANLAGMVGTPFVKLTDEGMAQARRTGQELQGKGVTVILCSPYIRAQQTAETIAGELGVGLQNLHIVDELHERRMGEAEGKPKVNETEWFYLNDDAPGMERRQELLDRSLVALRKIREFQPAQGTLVVVGHAVSGFYLLQAAKGHVRLADFDDFHQMSNADFIAVEVAET